MSLNKIHRTLIVCTNVNERKHFYNVNTVTKLCLVTTNSNAFPLNKCDVESVINIKKMLQLSVLMMEEGCSLSCADFQRTIAYDRFCSVTVLNF